MNAYEVLCHVLGPVSELSHFLPTNDCKRQVLLIILLHMSRCTDVREHAQDLTGVGGGARSGCYPPAPEPMLTLRDLSEARAQFKFPHIVHERTEITLS